MPSNACDCHGHVFEPADAVPYAHAPSYSPPPATHALHSAAMLHTGVGRAVVVQPSVYGTDSTVLRKALALGGSRLRGIAVADRTCPEADLEELKRSGVCGLRFVDSRLPNGAPFAGSVPLSELGYLAATLRQLGWHAEIWGPLSNTIEAWPLLKRAGVPIVLDHMGGFDARLGVDHPDFRRLVEWLKSGEVWVKLVLCRRIPVGSEIDSLREFHDALVEANPSQVLWGTDWPFVRMNNPPDTAHLRDLFLEWVADEAIIQKILVQSPAEVYGFQLLGSADLGGGDP